MRVNQSPHSQCLRQILNKRLCRNAVHTVWSPVWFIILRMVPQNWRTLLRPLELVYTLSVHSILPSHVWSELYRGDGLGNSHGTLTEITGIYTIIVYTIYFDQISFAHRSRSISYRTALRCTKLVLNRGRPRVIPLGWETDGRTEQNVTQNVNADKNGEYDEVHARSGNTTTILIERAKCPTILPDNMRRLWKKKY